MRTIGTILGLLWCGAAAALAGEANLVPNGNFEKGKGSQPDAWSKLDGITTFWEKTGGSPGHCIRMDSSVLKVNKQKFLADPEKFQGRGTGNQYATVAADEGVWIFSQPVPVSATDKYFIIEADIKSPEASSAAFCPQVFLRGYQKFDPKRDAGTSSWFQTPHAGGPAYSEQFGKAQRPAVEGDYLMVYRHTLVCRLAEKDKWTHFRMGFKMPDQAKYRPDVLLLKPFVIWPPANYYFDNLVLRHASKDEYEAAKREGHSIKGFMPTE